MPESPKNKVIRDDDSELIEAINSGRRELFSEIVTRYENRLYNFGLRMCGNVQDAEDLVQDTFLNIFKYLKDFRFESKFKNWVYRIATSSCIKKRRKSKYAPERELSLDDLLPGDENSAPRDVPDWASEPLDRLLNEELADMIQEAILDLPDKYRVVMVLRDLEGFGTTETAQILNLTPANVKVRLHRARLFLRDKLKEYFNDDGTPS